MAASANALMIAESFMAGNPFANGGFIIVNGLEFDSRGRIRSQRTPYPGGNLFSLASGGAIFIRDPYQQVVEEQLNGGELVGYWRLRLLQCYR